MSLIDCVKKGLCKADYESEGLLTKAYAEYLARAALEAASECVTEEMEKAGEVASCWGHGCECEPKAIFRAMLRRELDEGK